MRGITNAFTSKRELCYSRLTAITLLVLVLIATIGCFQVDKELMQRAHTLTSATYDRTKVSQIVVGKTTKSEVKTLLGEPRSINKKGDGVNDDIEQFAEGSVERYWYSDRTHIGDESEHSVLAVRFNAQGVVIDFEEAMSERLSVRIAERNKRIEEEFLKLRIGDSAKYIVKVLGWPDETGDRIVTFSGTGGEDVTYSDGIVIIPPEQFVGKLRKYEIAETWVYELNKKKYRLDFVGAGDLDAVEPSSPLSSSISIEDLPMFLQEAFCYGECG